MRCKPITQNENIQEHQTPAPIISKAYLLGFLHDSTERKYTYRICQKSFEFIQQLNQSIKMLGFNSWIYKEGKDRNLYIVEFSKKLLSNTTLTTMEDKIDYIRGYFDSEGSVPKSLSARYYIYFCQKDFQDLAYVRALLEEFGIQCGKIHVPSKRIDPNYYRFYVLCNSWQLFGQLIGSYHPEKIAYVRMKI